MTLNDYKILGRRISYSFLFIFLSRFIFLVFNLDYFSNTSVGDLISTFFVSVRFDLATCFIINLIPILLSIIPFRNAIVNKAISLTYIVSNILFLCIVIIDSKYFYYSGKKMTLDMLLIGKDIQNQSLQLILNFWFIGLLFFVMSFLFVRFRPKDKKYQQYKKLRFFKSIILGCLSFVALGIGIRGGVQMRSLSPKNAFVFDKYELGNFAINSAYTLIRSLENKGLKKIHYYSQEEVMNTIDPLVFANSSPQKDVNIIIILLESFSYEYFEQDYMPFLKSIAQKGSSFETAYANGRRSIEVLPSIMASLPSIIGSPISQSQYQTNKFNSLPKALTKYGYHNYFFHGGKPGTMDFDAYTKSIGFDEYLDSSDYPDYSHFDGNWGIFDHYFLDFMGEKLNKTKEPFFSTIFTLSSHQPYTLPAEFQNKFPKGTLAVHESIGYVDFALKQFFEKYQNEKWFKNSLFVFTADHTQKLETKKYNNLVGRYRVPIIFYRPGKKMDLRTDLIAQHVDIFPTIIDFIGEKEHIPLFGRSLFTDKNGKMLNFYSSSFIFHNESGVLTFNKELFKHYNLESNGLINSMNVDKAQQKLLKSYIQYGINGFIDNDL